MSHDKTDEMTRFLDDNSHSTNKNVVSYKGKHGKMHRVLAANFPQTNSSFNVGVQVMKWLYCP